MAPVTGDFADGTVRLVIAWQESRAGTEPSITMTTVRRDGEAWVLRGAKTDVADWSDDAVLLVPALADGQPGLFLVRPDTPGVRVSSRAMTDGSLSADIVFEDAVVPHGAAIHLGPEVQTALDGAVLGGTIALCAQLCGLATGALATTTAYIRQRRQFGRSIAEFQAVRHRMADMAIALELAGASWRRALAEHDNVARVGGAMPRELLRSVSAAKVSASEVAMRCAREGVQFHGAIGYTQECEAGLFLEAAMRWQSWLGAPGLHIDRVGRLMREDKGNEAPCTPTH